MDSNNNIEQKSTTNFTQETTNICKEETIEKNYSSSKRYNRKLFPIYRMFSWDLLFYYSIIFLFFTLEKGFTASQILLIDSFYPLFKMLVSMPCTTISDKIGKRRAIITGNILIALSLLIIVFSNKLIHIIIANLIMSIGYSFKLICEDCLLHECIEKGKNSNNQFSKINSKGSSFYYIFDAISNFLTGFLFVFNHYLPLFICLFFCLISVIISFLFEDYASPNQSKSETNKKDSLNVEYLSELIYSFKFIFNSQRLRALLIFNGLFAGLFAIRSSLASSLFSDIKIPEQYFGVAFAIFQLVSCIASLKQNYFHKKYKNKLLTNFSLKYTLCMIVLGIVVILELPTSITIFLVITLYIIQYFIKGPYLVLIQRYLNSFSTPEINTKIYTVNNILEALCGTIISLLASFLLSKVSTAYTLLIIGIIMFILLIIVLDYMKSRLGLKPQEYDKKDIEYVSPNQKKI